MLQTLGRLELINWHIFSLKIAKNNCPKNVVSAKISVGVNGLKYSACLLYNRIIMKFTFINLLRILICSFAHLHDCTKVMQLFMTYLVKSVCPNTFTGTADFSCAFALQFGQSLA